MYETTFKKHSLRILAISGSLRKASLNTALLRAVSTLAPADIRVDLYGGMDKLPLFNPDIEAADPPAVADLRNRLLGSDGVLIASPEYAHGVSGVLKNALDWMVGCEAFVNKPVALLNASPRATHALAALKETVTVMSARIIDEASVTVPVLGSKLGAPDVVSDPEISAALYEAILAFRRAITLYRAEAGAE